MSLAFFLGSQPAMAAEQASPPGASSPPASVPEAGPRLLELVNRERAAAGLTALQAAGDAAGIAQDWSGRMARAEKLSHNDDYFTPASMDRLDAVRVGENVAFADTVDEIHDMFMDSPPHRKNILNPEFREVGFGAARMSGGQLYVTEDFLTRRSEPAGSGRPADRPKAAAPAADSHRASAPPPKPKSRPAPARPRPARRPRPGSPAAASRPAADGAPRPVPAPAPAHSAASAASHPTPPPAPAAAAATPLPPAEAVSAPAEPAGAGTPAPAPTGTGAAPSSHDAGPPSADVAPSPEPEEAMPALTLTTTGASRPGSPNRQRDMLVGAAGLALVARIRRRRR